MVTVLWLLESEGPTFGTGRKTFIFPRKNVETSGDYLYHTILCPGLYISLNYLQLIEIVIFEKSVL